MSGKFVQCTVVYPHDMVQFMQHIVATNQNQNDEYTHIIVTLRLTYSLLQLEVHDMPQQI